MIQINLFTKQKQTHRHRKQAMVIKGEMCGGRSIRSLGLTHTPDIYKRDKQQDTIV